MTEPWFDPNHYAWIPGTAYGCIAGVMGGLVGWLVPRGRARRFILGAWFTLWAVAVVLLGIGIAALLNGQPYGVWYGLLLPGAIGAVVVGANSMVIVRRYREAEQKRLAAKDFL